MKNVLMIFLLALAAVTASAALPQPDLVAQIHFAGSQKFAIAPNAAAFTNEFSSPEAVALRAQTADKLSRWLPVWLQANVGVPVAGGAARLRPLFDDLQRAEWWMEARAPVGGRADVALAIKLDAARAQLWQANLRPFFPAASFKSGGGWLIFDSGTGSPKVGDALAQKIATPATGWLSVDINWPRLTQWIPQLHALGLPETRLSLTAPDDKLKVTGTLLFPDTLSLNLDPWQVPTGSLHQPFVSFTAVRGISAWLKGQAWAQPYRIEPSPNQAFVWALPQIPFQTFVAVPFPDAANALMQTYSRLQPIFSPSLASNPNGPVMGFSLQLTNREIHLTGVPFIAPYLQAIKEPAGQFLFGGVFPNTTRGAALPADLFTQLSARNMVLYHWEITAERFGPKLDLLPQLAQLGLMLTAHKQLDGQSAAYRWLNRVGPKLGNSVTQITQTGPAEMTCTRKSAGLFTAAEMFALANWLEADDFPGCDLSLPKRPAKLKRMHPNPAATVPAPAPAH